MAGDAILGLIVKRETARNSRGKQLRRTFVLTFSAPDIFDLQYTPEQHERFVRQEIRSLLRPRRFDLRTVETAKRWREAIQREAPLLKGFFAAEPKLRGQMLRWCDKVLG